MRIWRVGGEETGNGRGCDLLVKVIFVPLVGGEVMVFVNSSCLCHSAGAGSVNGYNSRTLRGAVKVILMPNSVLLDVAVVCESGNWTANGYNERLYHVVVVCGNGTANRRAIENDCSFSSYRVQVSGSASRTGSERSSWNSYCSSICYHCVHESYAKDSLPGAGEQVQASACSSTTRACLR